ncbi:MAG: cyclodeaminase/cyclohydrolase family protein [Treponemataceae bacterium]
MKLVEQKVKDFIAETASSSPAPGGGSVSALAGSLCVALGQMVVNLTKGKKAYAALPKNTQDEILDALKVLETKQADLIKLIDEDTDAFNSFMAALALPKKTDEEKAKRSLAMKEATILSLNVPLKTAHACCEALQHLKVLALYGNKNAISDVGVAALLGEAGLNGAVLNVKINLLGLDDEEKISKTKNECDELLKKGLQLKEEVLKIVNEKIS